MPEKPLAFVGAALAELRAFPDAARRAAGHQLHLVQHGLAPGDWKPMASVGPGVREIRIHTGVEHRVLYVAKFAEAVYVLHAFEKRTQQTRQADLDRARHRYQELLHARATASRSAPERPAPRRRRK
jgi:phage-related protein